MWDLSLMKRPPVVGPVHSPTPPPSPRPARRNSSSRVPVSSSSSFSPSRLSLPGGRSASHWDLSDSQTRRTRKWRWSGRPSLRGRQVNYYVADDDDDDDGGGVGRGGGLFCRLNRSMQNLRSSFSAGNFVQRFLPTRFSEDNGDDDNDKEGEEEEEDQDQDSCSSGSSSLHLSVAPAATSPSSPVRLHVYRINDGLGFYHTGVVFGRQEYTFCQDAGICRHKPGEVSFATFLGSVRLGSTAADRRQFQEILKDMREHGFGSRDYDVMANSCNSFTAELSRRLLDGRMDRYPSGVRHQSRIADMLSPVARALDLVPDAAEDDSPEAAAAESSARGGRREGRFQVRGSLRVASGSSKIRGGGGVGPEPSTAKQVRKEPLGKRRSL